MAFKIIIDSSGDVQEFAGVDFACAPLKIRIGEREYVDTLDADVSGMTAYLGTYKGKTSTACPSVGEYVEAYGDADCVFCITITSNLSGSYNAAKVAADAWKEDHPGGKIHIFDSLTAGPELRLLAERLREWIAEGVSFEEMVERGEAYLVSCHTLFSLESLHNLANNGRVPMAVAKIAGVLGIRMIGTDQDGRIKPIDKARGPKKVVPTLLKHMLEMGYAGGRLRISHCENLPAAEELAAAVRAQFPHADIEIGKCWCLTAFYAEKGGMIVGFETK